ncbi:nicotinate phosphoribosyltransferase [Poriferisphaera sp. WC338]|uniref:nicotinate phosphoribosyltransferase n=1 Tax=Poriferisphaera sp. WC338 TaxID=3425129 RepID=UPI003D815DC1
MGQLNKIYRTPLTLLTDLYQLTMAYGYWKQNYEDRESVFHLFFRKPPFNGGYAITAGLEQAIDLMTDFHFNDEDLEYLASLNGNDGQPLFENGFLSYLSDLQFTCDVDAVPEGSLVFGNEPIIRIRGPILQAQIIETALLNIINFQTLIATKASRICSAAGDDDVLEFGLRRAQGIDGALTASRAAYIGGCDATSNVLAGKLFGIPVRGTHAHSWVMSFDDEYEAFERYAESMPNNCVFLVDTYDTLAGVKNAIEVGKQLRLNGHEMVGIRLDSGDLAYLSIEARRLLDDAGFKNAAIVASNDLDENIIQNLKLQNAQIAVWGVGTKLATSFDQPALGGVYKLGAIRDTNGQWKPRMKMSEQVIKTSIPGMLQVKRFKNEQGFVADMIYDELTEIKHANTIVDPKDPTRHKKINTESTCEDLLIPIMRQGEAVCSNRSTNEIRDYVKDQLAMLHPGTKRFMNPHEYPVGLELNLHALRNQLIEDARDHVVTTEIEL